MDKLKVKNYGKRSPEAKVSDAKVKYLKLRDWYVMKTHGNQFQRGLPDLFACHARYGYRWIEVKLPKMKGSRYTNAQLDSFPQLCSHGSAVYVMTGADDEEYSKLFVPCNWASYLKKGKK